MAVIGSYYCTRNPEYTKQDWDSAAKRFLEAEHDEDSLLEEQVLAMRRAMERLAAQQGLAKGVAPVMPRAAPEGVLADPGNKDHGDSQSDGEHSSHKGPTPDPCTFLLGLGYPPLAEGEDGDGKPEVDGRDAGAADTGSSRGGASSGAGSSNSSSSSSSSISGIGVSGGGKPADSDKQFVWGEHMLQTLAPEPERLNDDMAYFLELRVWLAAARAVYKPSRFVERLAAGLGRARFVCGEAKPAAEALGLASAGVQHSEPKSSGVEDKEAEDEDEDRDGREGEDGGGGSAGACTQALLSFGRFNKKKLAKEKEEEAEGETLQLSDKVSEVGADFADDADASSVHVVMTKERSETFLPAFVLYIDEQREAVVLSIRGTSEMRDWVTDGAGKVVPFLGVGRAHTGMAMAARLLLGLTPQQMRDAELFHCGESEWDSERKIKAREREEGRSTARDALKQASSTTSSASASASASGASEGAGGGAAAAAAAGDGELSGSSGDDDDDDTPTGAGASPINPADSIGGSEVDKLVKEVFEAHKTSRRQMAGSHDGRPARSRSGGQLAMKLERMEEEAVHRLRAMEQEAAVAWGSRGTSSGSGSGSGSGSSDGSSKGPKKEDEDGDGDPEGGDGDPEDGDGDPEGLLAAAYGGKEEARKAIRFLRQHGAGHPSDGHRPAMVRLIQKLLDDRPSFRMIVTGHSLGAGVAGLVTMLLARHLRFSPAAFDRCGIPNECKGGQRGSVRGDDERDAEDGSRSRQQQQQRRFPFQALPLHCYGFAPPASSDESLCMATRGLVTSIVAGDDIIPRFSLSNALQAYEDLLEAHGKWWPEFDRDVLLADWRRRAGNAVRMAGTAVSHAVAKSAAAGLGAVTGILGAIARSASPARSGATATRVMLAGGAGALAGGAAASYMLDDAGDDEDRGGVTARGELDGDSESEMLREQMGRAREALQRAVDGGEGERRGGGDGEKKDKGSGDSKEDAGSEGNTVTDDETKAAADGGASEQMERATEEKPSSYLPAFLRNIGGGGGAAQPPPDPAAVRRQRLQAARMHRTSPPGAVVLVQLLGRGRVVEARKQRRKVMQAIAAADEAEAVNPPSSGGTGAGAGKGEGEGGDKPSADAEAEAEAEALKKEQEEVEAIREQLREAMARRRTLFYRENEDEDKKESNSSSGSSRAAGEGDGDGDGDGEVPSSTLSPHGAQQWVESRACRTHRCSLDRILFSPFAVRDHLCGTYEAALDDRLARLCEAPATDVGDIEVEGVLDEEDEEEEEGGGGLSALGLAQMGLATGGSAGAAEAAGVQAAGGTGDSGAAAAAGDGDQQDGGSEDKRGGILGFFGL